MEGKITSSDFLQFVRASKGRQPSLTYFTELANQYPRYSESRPAVIRHPLSSMQPATVVQSRPNPSTTPAVPEPTRYDSLSTVSGSLNETEFPTLSSLSLRDRPAAVPRPTVASRSSATPQGLGTPADDPFATDSPISPRTNDPFATSSESLRAHVAQRDPGRMDFAFRFPSSLTSGSDRRAFFAEQERNRAEKMRQNLAPSDRSDRGSERQFKADDAPLSSMTNMVPRVPSGQTSTAHVVDHGPRATAWPSYEAPVPPAVKTLAESFQVRQAQPPPPTESRARMLEYLNRVGEEHHSQSQPAPQEQRRPQRPEPVSNAATSAAQMVRYEKPTSAGSQVSRSALRTSDPEPGYYENRHANIYNSFDVSGPTPQNFKGPFFQDTAPTHENPTAHRSVRKSRADNLDEWWNSGTLTQRHDAFLKSLIIPTGSGSIKDDKNFMVTDRVLIPLYETLASYVRLPGEAPKAPDHFARFASPPEWTIDRTRDGDKSFFGEDWGETPRRIGRDPRFQPTFGQPRYTLYEEQHEEPFRGFGGEMRGYHGGSGYADPFGKPARFQQF